MKYNDRMPGIYLQMLRDLMLDSGVYRVRFGVRMMDGEHCDIGGDPKLMDADGDEVNWRGDARERGDKNNAALSIIGLIMDTARDVISEYMRTDDCPYTWPVTGDAEAVIHDGELWIEGDDLSGEPRYANQPVSLTVAGREVEVN